MFSKLKKLKSQLPGSKQKPDSDAGGGRVDPKGSALRPEPHVLMDGGHDQEGGRSNVVWGDVFSMNLSSQPNELEPMPACGSEDDREGGGVDIRGREVSQMHLDLHPDVRVEVGSGLHQEGNGAGGEEVERVYPSLSTPSTVEMTLVNF